MSGRGASQGVAGQGRGSAHAAHEERLSRSSLGTGRVLSAASTSLHQRPNAFAAAPQGREARRQDRARLEPERARTTAVLRAGEMFARSASAICLLPVEAFRARGDAEDAAAAAGRDVAVDENVERKV